MDVMIISVRFLFNKLLRVVYCFVITTALVVQTSNTVVDAAGIKSVSPPNRLVTRHRLNNHQRWIMVQGNGDHDLYTEGSYAEAMVMFSSTQTSWPSKRQ
jgi:hypothetical protein